MPWEDVKDILRPNMDDVHMGIMKADEDKCNQCGLCMENCPFRAWEKNEAGLPVMKDPHECFSCYNCMVACPNDAISIVEPYHVDSGFWETDSRPLPAVMPLEPKDEFGNPTKWNAIEEAIFNRRSVRNYKDKPVPDHLIQRVLEAGRFAPSAGNCQPWKFIVITDKALIKEMDQVTTNLLTFMYNGYIDDKGVKNLVPMIEGPPLSVAGVDPRVILGGMGTIVKNKEPPSLNAPAVIILLGDERSIASPDLNVGICGMAMNMVANTIGIKCCWNGFMAAGINFFQPLKKKLGVKNPWRAITSICLGYPRFKQEGIVPREYRPVTWFRAGAEGPEIHEEVDVPEKQEA